MGRFRGEVGQASGLGGVASSSERSQVSLSPSLRSTPLSVGWYQPGRATPSGK